MYDLSGGDDTPDIRIGYVGGGSQGWAHTLINDLAQTTALSGEVALYDIEYEAAARNAELGNQVTADASGEWTYEAHRDRADALRDADFVVCSTQDDPNETFVHDLDIPREYGIHQTVGDTVGPGGTFRALRSIPQYREIAATVRDVRPDAWVINYTNPMTVCTRALYEEYPDINAIGLCHEVFKTQELFADLVEEAYGESTDRSEVAVNVKGINHFTWVDEARWRDRDVFGLLDDHVADTTIPGFEPGDMDGESYWVDNNQVAFDFYRRYGLLGAAGDRHLVEFVPGYLDIDRPEDLHRWGIQLTPSSERRENPDGPTATERYLAGEEFEFTESGEEAVDVMRALLGGEPLKTHLNAPNRGQVDGLPRGAVVETNALLTGDSVDPLSAGGFPRELRTLVRRHVANQETLVEAGFVGDLDLAFRAFRNDPLVTVQPDRAAAMFRDLAEAERPYLGAYDFAGAEVI
jgi:alpha-galactosidase